MQALGQRAVGDQGDSIPLAVVEKGRLDGSIHQAVTHLVRNDPILGQGRLSPFQFAGREVADAYEPYAATVHALFHRCQGLLDGDSVIRPVTLLEIDTASLQPLEASFGS